LKHRPAAARLATAIGLATAMIGGIHADEPTPKPPLMKGFSWGFPGVRGDFTNPEAGESLRRLRDLGVEWVAICFAGHMPETTSPSIAWGADDPTMVTDEEIRQAVDAAHRLGLKTLLKPMVDIRTGHWRGHITLDAPGWEGWWRDYKRMIVHYATLAADARSEMLAVGCEMVSTERFETHWRDLVGQVRRVYPGPLTYNANHGGVGRVTWWDALDLISVSAYCAVGKGAGSTIEEMQASWRPVKAELAAISRKYGKPIFFIELGMMSIRGNSRHPSRWDNKDDPFDGEEQARYYEAALRAFWDEPWFAGFFWWKWDAVPSRPEASSRNTARETVVGDKGFRIVGKPAEEVVRRWYAKETRRP
jgi:hypothetical protein